ncbi:hypothetical protein T11_8526 [Trichinella zimbabwensis]|uniref:Uncharacterized protein n=1 Tax=Trichinella zimbabwensis TaxID=268475 RepID=A0A0V1I4S2_9BILA|nr:hypothetical protein T11_8526 [Trichinella zimbabwensis]
MWNFLYVENIVRKRNNALAAEISSTGLAGIGVRFSDAYLREENRNVDCPQVTHSSDNRMLPVPVTRVRFGAFELCHSCRMNLHERDSPLTEIGQRPPQYRYINQLKHFHILFMFHHTNQHLHLCVHISTAAAAAAAAAAGGGSSVDTSIPQEEEKEVAF